MKRLLIVFVALSAFAADIDVAAAKKAEQQSCTQCHSMRLTHSQRLSKTAWGKELDKMAGWGAPIKDRQLLLDYLSAEYSDNKPVPQDPLSSNGTSAK
jgi:hypothetical protein